ncbi:MAG: hydroxymethylglutaryl-CoA lyase, partial [Pseudomonadota bacterium]
MAERAVLFEVGPRDGLQNEARFVETADKVRLVDMLTDAGLSEIEVTSFVSPKWVPQMADAAEVMARVRPGPCFSVLVPNLRGFEAALAAGAGKVAVFGAASESFSKANINCSIEESFERFAPVMEAARGVLPVRGYISCVTDCPFEGEIAPEAVARVAARLRAMGCAE